ncbi:hypothetical protein MNB_SV-5-1584 [hydrothermal vent metagenome]|uniref:Entericidin EcnAB n=1 Tax=hydrothermal vent metagenome TaxID=652676 RepID=A0A1W1EF09_9ZZZZ
MKTTTIAILLFSIFFLSACATPNAVEKDSAVAWESTKKTSGEVWDETKKVSNEAWHSTKKTIHEATAE